jgi:tripartite-type tricarboxylate transporter receptor subunit TctC
MEIDRVLSIPENRQKLEGLGCEIAAGTPEQFSAYMREQSNKWGELIRDARITAN